MVTTQTNRSTLSAWLSVAVLCAGQLMIVIDQNIVNVALPTVQHDLGFSSADLVWVVNAYVIPFGGLLLLAGRLGDLLGRRSVLLTGIGLFSLASLACGLATDQGMLIAFRLVQGVGGAVASACVLGMIVTLFTGQRDRAQAIGAFSFASAGGGALGPLLGGVFTAEVTWHWIFFVNVPIGAAVMVSALRLLRRENGIGLARGADYLGAVLVTSGLMLGVYTVVHAEQVGWGATQTLVFGPLAVLLLAGFLLREATAATPLLPLRVFRSRNLSGANAVQFLMIAAMFGLLYFGTQYLQRVLHEDALHAGLGFVPIAVVIAAVSLGRSARLVTRFGGKPVLVTGLVLIVVAFALLARVPVHGTYLVDVLPATVVMGLGFGVAMPALTGLGMSDVAAEDSGVASGLFNTTQQIGGALGLTALSAVANTQGPALTSGYRLVFAVAAGLVIAAIAVALLVSRTRTTD
ncbi:MAG TPA: DHA2 family efflux MFS transporter permease subunit [Pseudonocardiaceae bacterium]|nr:DHA2 family efflux MFS transporter permease subunit [Pseudonocardiaceae bacterium]